MGTSMRLAAFFVMVCMMAAPAAQRTNPFLPVAVEYAPDSSSTRAGVVSDLQTVRTLHFNSIRFTLRWSEAEPVRGAFAFETLQRVLEVAAQTGLRAIVRIDESPPAWVLSRYSDAARKTADVPVRGRIDTPVCFDHPGARADLWRFVTAAARTSARFESLFAIDVASDPPVGLCLCPHTRQRLEARGGAGRDNPAVAVRGLLRDDLANLASRVREGAPLGVAVASFVRRPSLLRSVDGEVPGQDDWLMRRAVDQYGTSIDASAASSAKLALALDAMSAGGAFPGWWLDLDPSVPERDRRLVTWAAISRRARAVIFEDPPEPGLTAIIARNPALFSQLSPRRARVALVEDANRSSGSAQRLASIHQALAARQIAVDIVQADQLTPEVKARYRVVVDVSHATRTQEADEIARLAGGPEVRIQGGEGVEVRILESESVQMIVGLNYSSASQRVTMTFPPETQEAIWQNMETGASVHFIAGAGVAAAGVTGPSYTHWFRPKDALVLIIRKDIR